MICPLILKYTIFSLKIFIFQLDIKPLPTGKFWARDNRRRTSVGHGRRSSVGDNDQQHLSHRRGSREDIQLRVKLLLSFLLGLFIGVLGMFEGNEHLIRNNQIDSEGDLL